MLCTVQHSADIAALSWTQAGDGLLAADTRGCVVMYRVPEPGDLSGRGTRLVHVWTGSSSMLVLPQTLLAAGTNVMSPAASASPGSRQVGTASCLGASAAAWAAPTDALQWCAGDNLVARAAP